MFKATLAAPPARDSMRSICTTGTGAAMQEHGRLGAPGPAALPIDDMALADIQYAAVERLDLGIQRAHGIRPGPVVGRF